MSSKHSDPRNGHRETPVLPKFDDDGCLPSGDYALRLTELRCPMLVEGPKDDRYTNWDRAWRDKLVSNLAVLVRQLWQVGVTAIFVDGSFVEDKEHPNDIDEGEQP